MIYDGCMCKCREAYKKMRNLTLFTIASVGVGTGIYLVCKRVKEINEDKEYYRRYTEDNPEEDYIARMDFYEAEFKRQDEEEEAELKRAVDEFNSKRLKREQCPHCDTNTKERVKNRRNKRQAKKSINLDVKDYPKEEY